MQYQEFLDIVLGRARTLKFLDPDTAQVDGAECELAAHHALQELCDGWELDAFMVINDSIAITSEGVTTYPLPGNFGRLRTPRDADESGLFLRSREEESPNQLWYRDAEDWYRNATTSRSRPGYFMISGSTLHLDPPPDANGGNNYIVQGIYVRKIEQMDGNDPILISHPSALIDATLARLAVDKGSSQAQTLIAERERSIMRLINNQSRIKQQFRQRYLLERSLRGWRGR